MSAPLMLEAEAVGHFQTGLHRGHKMTKTPGDPLGWRYTDGVPVSHEPSRPCGACRRKDDANGNDGCLGELPGVVNACCGHGSIHSAYAVLDDGRRLAGADAIDFFRDCGRNPVVDLTMAYYAASWGAMAKTASLFPSRAATVADLARRATRCAILSTGGRDA